MKAKNFKRTQFILFVFLSFSSIAQKDNFSNNYFLTTNNLPVEKGGHYFLLAGAWQTAINLEFNRNISTSLVSPDLFLNSFYSISKKKFSLSEKIHFSVGGCLFQNNDFERIGGIPFLSLTYGTPNRNMTIQGGVGMNSEVDYEVVYIGSLDSTNYDSVLNKTGRSTGVQSMVSISGMTTLNLKTIFIYEVFATFDIIDQWYLNGMFVSAGFRSKIGEKNSIQYGVNLTNGGYFIVPLPMIAWYRSF